MSAAADPSKNMDAGNSFAIMTALAFLFTLPVAILIEGPSLRDEWDAVVAKGEPGANELLLRILGSAISFYTYNEVCRSTHPDSSDHVDARHDASAHRQVPFMRNSLGVVLHAEDGPPCLARRGQHRQARRPHRLLRATVLRPVVHHIRSAHDGPTMDAGCVRAHSFV